MTNKTPPIKIEFSPNTVGPRRPLQVRVTGPKHRQFRFCLDGLGQAEWIGLAEDPDAPGIYTAEWQPRPDQSGDDCHVVVHVSGGDDESGTIVSTETLSVSAVPPVLRALDIEPKIVANGETCTLRAVFAAADSLDVQADLSGLDSTQTSIRLTREKNTDTYSATFTVAPDNALDDGLKRVVVGASDPFDNKAEAVVITVGLANAALEDVVGGKVADGLALSRVGVRNPSDLRAAEPEALARASEIAPYRIRRYQSRANLCAMGATAEVTDSLINALGITSAASLAMVNKDAIRDAIAPSEAAEPQAAAEEIADALSTRARQALDGLAQADIKDKVKASNSCAGQCAEHDSAFGCFAYLMDLIRAAGFTSSNQLRTQFGWDIVGVTDESVTRAHICLEILRPVVQINPQNLYQQRYETALQRLLIAVTGRSQKELATDPVYESALSAATLADQNRLLRHLENIKLRKATQNSKIPAGQGC